MENVRFIGGRVSVILVGNFNPSTQVNIFIKKIGV
jgi:hypothetical protein